MRKLSLALLAVSLAGCASIPQPKPQDTRKVVITGIKDGDTGSADRNGSMRAVPLSASRPIAQPETKPATFNQRWYDRLPFMRHKAK